MHPVPATTSQPLTLVTGATGFLGHHVLAELLRRRIPCLALVRPPLDVSLGRLEQLVSDLNINFREALHSGLLMLLPADLRDAGALALRGRCNRIVHCAASTRFTTHESGEPARTNVDGTEVLLNMAVASGIREFHYVSTAFVCGKRTLPVPEMVDHVCPDSHNDYEQSKWQAEQLCVEWSRRHNGTLTIHRPSIIVGAFDSGRATKFDGFYLTARATDLVARRSRKLTGLGDARQHLVSLRVRARPQDRQNVVPVDWVARMIAGIALDPSLQGIVYHLVNPLPPSNRLIQRAIEDFFRITGSALVAPESFPNREFNADERLFEHISHPIAHYMVDTPQFHRRNTTEAESRLAAVCPTYDVESLHRLLDYGHRANWGKSGAWRAPDGPGTCADFFERFLPTNVNRWRVAKEAAVNVTVRFVIGDDPLDNWICRFDRGSLIQVLRAQPHLREDFGYRASRRAFWSAISGRVHPQDLFLSGEAEIFGDTERALKMVMILHAFSREFPFDEQSTPQTSGQRRSA